MRHLFFKQSGMTILFQTQFGVAVSYGFKESRQVYANRPTDDDDDSVRRSSEEEENEEAAEKEKTSKKKTSEAEDIARIQGKTSEKVSFVDTVFSRTSERQREQVDRFVQELPVDIDPAEVQKAKADIEREYGEKQSLYNSVKKEIEAFASASGRTGMGVKKLEDDIGGAFFKTVPLLNLDVMKNKKSDLNWITPEHVYDPLRSEIFNTLKRTAREGEKVDLKAVNALARKLSEYVPKFVENLRNVISRLDLLQRAIVGINENIIRKETEKRLLQNAERYLGFPLKEGVMLQGFDVKWTEYEGTGPEKFKKYKKTWRVMAPEIEKTVRKEGEAKVILKNVLVRLHDTATGTVIAMPLNNMRDFIYLHEITPVVKNKDDLYDKVDYLTKMGIKLKAGDELEFDILTRDEKSKETYSQANKVKILSIDNKSVKFDKEILYRAKWDSPDLADHEFKSEMTLGEFSRWLNVRHALPTISDEEMNDKLNEHYEYLNKTYNRNKNCHRQIVIRQGEIIYAEAPEKPMYQITNVQPGIIEISYGQSRKQFTNVQFLRWIYENDLEPFDPELQAERAKTYLGYSKKKSQQVLKDSNDAIKFFKDKGIWRDSFEYIKRMRGKNLIPDKNDPDVKIVEPLDAHQHSQSAIAEFWRDTKVLRANDIFQIFKHYWEFFFHNLERKHKERYSAVGKGMPLYGSDFARLHQEAENEEVDHLKKGMKEWPPPEIYNALFKAHDKDQLKACIDLLCEKGKFRWDDPRIWEKINHFNSSEFQIPIPGPPGIDPYQPYKEGTKMFFKGRDVAGKTGFDLLPEAIDGLWGESTFTGWKRGNDNTLDEGCTKAYNKGKELEADPRGTGGVATELAILLEKHMNGVYIESSDYEGLLRFILEMGKAGGDDKLYYLLMGLTIKNPSTGRSIMPWDRLSFFIDKFGNQFPGIDYFTNKGLKRLPGTGEMYEGPWRKSHFEYLTRDWEKTARDNKKYTPTSAVEKFLYKEILTDDHAQIRLEKAIGKNAEGIDHDDYPYYGPALKENAIENLCNLRSGAQKISTQAYKNIYIGFSPRITALLEKIETEKKQEEAGQPAFTQNYYQKLVTTLTSFMRYDSILSKRFKRDENYFKLGRHDYNTTFNLDSTNKLQAYKDNLEGLMRNIITAYNPADRENNFDIAFKELPSTKNDPALKAEQKRIESAVENFGEKFEKMVAQDNGAKMIEILKKYEFTQPPPGSQSPQARLKARMKAQLSDIATGAPAAGTEQRGGRGDEY